jgi:GTPase SAR1 family protein
MKKVYKVITLGDQSTSTTHSGVGKTSIVESYINKRYSPITEPTLGACFYKKDVTYKNREYSLEVLTHHSCRSGTLQGRNGITHCSNCTTATAMLSS